MQFTKIIETGIYSSNLKQMNDFYIDILALDLFSEEKDRHVFLKAGKSMLLIFNPNNTLNNINDIFPSHGAFSPPSIIHFAFEIKREDYEKWGSLLKENKISIEKGYKKKYQWWNWSKAYSYMDKINKKILKIII